MLGKYEKRHFNSGEKIWIGTYRNLTNLLHWHSECELIRIVSGNAQIKIGNRLFYGKEGQCFFCGAEELHYIIGEKDSLIDIMFFHGQMLKKITEKYMLVSPLLSNSQLINKTFEDIRQLIIQKPRFYSETLENRATALLLTLFNNNEICRHNKKKQSDKRIIDMINERFATITFNEIVAFSGYSTSHFSKIFKKLTGMTFSDYLNYVKIEYAVSLIQNNSNLTVTDVCLQCGFSTIRNFNRVFKKITGFTPSTLPDNFITDSNIGIYDNNNFDPTSQTSILL